MKKVKKIIAISLLFLATVGVSAWQYYKWTNRDNLNSGIFWNTLTKEKALQAGATNFGQITHGGLGSYTVKNFTLKIDTHYEVRFSGSPSWGNNSAAFAKIAPLSKNPDQPIDSIFSVRINKSQLTSDVVGLETSKTNLSQYQFKQLVDKAQEKLNNFLVKFR